MSEVYNVSEYGAAHRISTIAPLVLFDYYISSISELWNKVEYEVAHSM